MTGLTALQLEFSADDGVTIPSFSQLDGTFTPATDEPFQRWFPYLEGYSSDFVQKVISRFAPRATTILDPFAGTGTTAFVAGQRGIMSHVCEVNPVMQFVFETKVGVRRAGPAERSRLVGRLQDLVAQLPSLIEEAQPELGLEATYCTSFARSLFFQEGSRTEFLRLRTVVDELQTTDPSVGSLLMLATIASLVPCSLLKRAGDLRYKTPKELAKGVPPVRLAVANALRMMTSDIQSFSESKYLRTRPVIVCGDARTLVRIPSLGVDAVITSPPYINGTNYFRNTRLELWFMRCLQTAEDLARFRHKAVTAGINDVANAREIAYSHPDVSVIVERLKENAYDARIPTMVAAYFADMQEIFEAISKHLTADAVLAVDLGDSMYGGVHVPANDLLSAILKDIGYRKEQEILLRRRRSKGGAALSQVLLVFRAPQHARRLSKAVEGAWVPAWSRFCQEVPHQKAPYASRNWGSPIHSLCSYPGKLKPAIAHHLVETFVPPKGRVLDPFAGVGTIPFEAALSGRQSFGLELSAAAFPIAAAKVNLRSAVGVDAVLGELAGFIECYKASRAELQEAKEFGLNGRIVDYYHPKTLLEVLAARAFFAKAPPLPSYLLAKAGCLHILHGNRPYAVSRRSHPLTPYKPSGPMEYRSLVDRLKDKLERVNEASFPAEYLEGSMYHQDATSYWPSEIDSLDAVITSPPFFDSTRFHVQNWLRLWFAGWTPEAFQQKPRLFVDERQKQGFEVYESILRQSRDRLRNSGVVVLHIGKSEKCNMAKELQRVAKKWFKSNDLFDESVEHCESHGVRDKGTVTSHQYLVLY